MTCLNCGQDLGKNNAKYCSNTCQQNFQRKEYISRWLSGNEKGYSGKTLQLANPIRWWLKETKGSACSKCGWDGHHESDNSSLTEIDHIDGNASNCRPENLRILCPNCHSMTPTFRARNLNSKRKR